MDRLFLQEIVLRCAVGVTAAERQRRQTLLVDLDLFYTWSSVAALDDPQKILDYREVSRVLHAAVVEREFKLIEAVAEHLAGVLLQRFPLERVRVRVLKPKALSDQGVGRVGVEIERTASR